MSWKIKIDAEANKEYLKLDGSLKKQVLAGILKYQKTFTKSIWLWKASWK